MEFTSIIYSVDEGIAKMVLNRPEVLNSFSPELRTEMAEAIALAANDPAVRVLILTGTGRAFSAGGDVKAMAAGVPAPERRDTTQDVSRKITVALMNMEKPVIAMVNGFAVGAGCNIALACDIVIASEEAKFSEIFVRIAAVPDLGGIFLLPRAVGLHKAKELIFTGDMIDAREAERIGLTNKVVPAAELESTVMELARRLAKGPTRTIGMAKLLLHRALNTDLASAVELEAMGQAIIMQTDDHKEGARAFVEKRQAEFKGR